MSIVGRILFQEMIKFVYYEGGMTESAVQSSLAKFKDCAETKVMVRRAS